MMRFSRAKRPFLARVYGKGKATLYFGPEKDVTPQHNLTWVLLWAILRVSIGGAGMVTKIQRWGNSQGLRLARQVLEDTCISVGDDVDVVARDGIIVISPVRRVRGRQNLQELVSRIPKNYKQEEPDWGKPVGREVW
jgi:antitoxin MazE